MVGKFSIGEKTNKGIVIQKKFVKPEWTYFIDTPDKKDVGWYHESELDLFEPVRMRGFEVVPKQFRKHPDKTIILPTRGTKRSAGYDFYSPIRLEIKPNETVTLSSDICAYMQEDEVLKLFMRSSLGIKKKIRLMNSTGVLDSDYYANTDNHGNIGLAFHNFGTETVIIEEGERVCQGVFQKYLIADNDKPLNSVRNGGIGSTGK